AVEPDDQDVPTRGSGRRRAGGSDRDAHGGARGVGAGRARRRAGSGPSGGGAGRHELRRRCGGGGGREPPRPTSAEAAPAQGAGRRDRLEQLLPGRRSPRTPRL
ncbi:MAG: hypothetical protein AVDCRST_MAG69-870, partial [uncultured Solirubrobacteraceae bacterium]